MTASRCILAAASATATVCALAAPAHAATVTTLPCVPVVTYSTASMPIGGSGFTPGALVTLRYASAVAPTPTYLTAVTADAAGGFQTAANPAIFAKFDTQQQTFGLSATDGVNPALVAITEFKQTRVGYSTNPSTGKPTRQARHTVRGFPVGKSTYLHFRFNGRTQRNVKLGVTKSPCGTVSKRMRLLPTRSRPGKWTVYADQAKSYSKSTQPQLKYSFTISRSFF